MASPYAVLFYQIMRQSHDWQLELNKYDATIGLHRADFIFDEQGKVFLQCVKKWSDEPKPPNWSPCVPTRFADNRENVGKDSGFTLCAMRLNDHAKQLRPACLRKSSNLYLWTALGHPFENSQITDNPEVVGSSVGSVKTALL